jgi:hypothetical protein
VGIGHLGRHHCGGACRILASVGNTPISIATALEYMTFTSEGSLKIENIQQRWHMKVSFGD